MSQWLLRFEEIRPVVRSLLWEFMYVSENAEDEF
jgi:hypothetical protein